MTQTYKLPDYKQCPYCAEDIKGEALKCKHCGSDISGINTIDSTKDKSLRKCLQCGYSGGMKTWLRWYSLPQLIAIVLLLAYMLPGIIFIAWAWGKYKCPKCGALAKNVQV